MSSPLPIASLLRIRAILSRVGMRCRGDFAKIAFLGLGNMGAGMAHCLRAAGHPLVVWNRTPDKAASLVAAGARLASSPEEAISEADVVITSLMDDASIRSLFDLGGKPMAALRPRAVHLCVTTISPSCADWLTEAHVSRGSLFVSGPVVGRPDAARSGLLLQFLAGDAKGIKRVRPICNAFAARTIHLLGPASTANKQKLCVNFFAISLIEAMAENLTFAESIGASRQIAAGFLKQIFAVPAIKQYAERLAVRNTDGHGGFAMSAGMKDVGLMLDEAHRASCRIELGEVIADKMREALELGMQDMDWSSIQEISRRRAGLDHRQASISR
jgi:3-hydroxyisobutyrate dehydrogenase-like beta-hydroxyacid dehydrogenase